ncbi:hypothetical protein [Nocardia sp. NPDC050710]|uniref:hypothetical protein n=1 Tax=Nocardia sp. NPDC050710 TaxID=3157220 RepID=UPI0033CA76AA
MTTAGRSASSLEFWDPTRWQPRAVRRRILLWVNATRRRRWSTWLLIAVFGLVIFPAVVGVISTAHASSSTEGSAAVSALSWTQVKDTSGVDLSSYMFATDRGAIWRPQDTVMSLVISMEFAGWLAIVTTGIWFIGYTLSFRWMDSFASILRGVAGGLTETLATPLMLATAAAIGAFVVAWFIVRGYHAKATLQTITMLAVAVVGPVFLADPLADVLSSDGWLAQGRNVGLSVAAGLNGDANPNPAQLVPVMQAQMADNFARKPLQVWNFGHIVDMRGACGAAWSAGARTGENDRLKSAIKGCGDNAAYQQTEHPSVGQISSGLLMILSALVFLVFAAYLATKIISRALHAVYHGLMSIFGFAAGGFVYGPTQTFLVRNLVDAFIAAVAMALYTIALAFYLLFLGLLFEQAQDQVMRVLILGAIVQFIAVSQLKTLGASLDRGNDWIANRFALAIQGGGGGGTGSGSGGGTALGMGTMRSNSGGSGGMGFLAGVGAINALNLNPATAWLAGGVRGPLNPLARKEARATKRKYKAQGKFFEPANAQSIMKWVPFVGEAKAAAKSWGGINSIRGAGAAMAAVMKQGGGIDSAYGALRGAKFRDKKWIPHLMSGWQNAWNNAERQGVSNKDLGFALSSMKQAHLSASRLVSGRGSAEEVAAHMTVMQEAALEFSQNSPHGIRLGSPQARQYLRDYMNGPDHLKAEKMEALSQWMKGDTTTAIPHAHADLTGLTTEDARQIQGAIGAAHARRVNESVANVLQNPHDERLWQTAQKELADAAYSDMRADGKVPTPWSSGVPPVSGRRSGWSQALSPVGRHLELRPGDTRAGIP